jgi:hypothetical protein
VLLFLSLTQETWQAFGDLEGWRVGAVLTGFGLLSLVIPLVGLRAERAELASPEPGPELAGRARQTPAAPLVARGVEPATPPLDRIERVNLAGGAAGHALAAGARRRRRRRRVLPLRSAGRRRAPHRGVGRQPAERPPLGQHRGPRGRRHRGPRARAIVLGAFASLYFAAVALGDDRNRETFLDDVLQRFRRVMAAWAYYRGARPARGAAA